MVKQQPRSNPKTFYLILGAVVVIGVAFLYYQMRGGGEAPQVATIDPNVPLPKAEGYLLGNPNAPVTIVEYADFECPACAYFATITEPDVRKRLVETGQANLRYMHYHIPSHVNTWAASHAAACANEQGKFWEMHDSLYYGQDRWNSAATRKPKGVFEGMARGIGLNMDQWESCFDTQKYQPQLMASQKDAESRKVTGTPTFIIGTRMIGNSLSYDQIKAFVDSAAATAKPTTPNDSAKS
jgi:protein-disulfide isomerase